MKSRKSQGHVEMIISLILFVGAILFIFIFINPLSKNQEKVSYIKNVEKEFLKNTSAKFAKLSIVSTNEDGCYKFDPEKYKEEFDNKNFINVDYISVLDPNPENSDKYKYTLYFSEVFNSNIDNNNKVGCNKSNFVLSSYSEENMIVYEKIKELKDLSENDYESVKKNLGINRDFSFSLFYLENKSEVPELSFQKKNPAWTEKESEYIPIIAIEEIEGNIEIHKLMLNLIVW